MLSDDHILFKTVFECTVNSSTADVATNILQTSISVMKTVSEQVKFDRDNDVSAILKSFGDLERMKYQKRNKLK